MSHPDDKPVQPEAVQPEAVQPEAVQPEAVQPETVQPEAAAAEAMDPTQTSESTLVNNASPQQEPTLPVLSELPTPSGMSVPSGLPVPSGSPYRVAEPAEVINFAAPFAAPKRPRPIIGPALSVFGVLLWAFVVAGQFTTSWMMGTPLNQAVALGMIGLATFAAWIMSLRRSHIVMPSQRTLGVVGRALAVAVLSFLLFVVCVAVATVVGSASSRGHDMLIAFMLVVVATIAAIVGPRMTSPTRPERSHGQRFALIVMWLVGALLTLVAGADLASNG